MKEISAMQVHTVLELELGSPMGILLRLAARGERLKAIRGEEQLALPVSPSESFLDVLGNPVSRLTLKTGMHQIDYRLTAQPDLDPTVDPSLPFSPIQKLPVDTLLFLQPSRYVDSDRLGAVAFEVLAGASTGGEQVLRLFEWVKKTFPYTPGMSERPLSASEVLKQAHGVCRDLAHVLIGMIRAISIPSRYVVGYVRDLDPQDVHAWVEVFVGGRWYALDPTYSEPGALRAPVMHGRDAADVAIMDQFGPLPIRSEMSVSVW